MTQSTFKPKGKLDRNDSAPIIINEIRHVINPGATIVVEELVNWTPAPEANIKLFLVTT